MASTPLWQKFISLCGLAQSRLHLRYRLITAAKKLEFDIIVRVETSRYLTKMTNFNLL
jgi:hypothetical protein